MKQELKKCPSCGGLGVEFKLGVCKECYEDLYMGYDETHECQGSMSLVDLMHTNEYV